MTREDEACVIICCPSDAKRFCTEDPDIIDALVITNLMPEGEAIVVPKDEFIRWTKGEGNEVKE